jgi:hypothetical protein
MCAVSLATLSLVVAPVRADECLLFYHCQKSGTCKVLGQSCQNAPDPINIGAFGFSIGGWASSYEKTYFPDVKLGMCKPGSAGGPCRVRNVDCGFVKFYRLPGCAGYTWMKTYTASSCTSPK